jgi:hypothetical protein
MIPVVFYPGWNESVSDYLTRIALQTPGSSARWGRIIGTDKPGEARYAVCQDSPISIYKALSDGFQKSQIVYIKREADSALPQLIDPHILSYQGPNNIIPSVWWISVPFDELVSMSPYFHKDLYLSAIVSANTALKGHRDRLTFVRKVSSKHAFDVYGRGHAPDSFSGNYRGELLSPGRCKLRGLQRYQYSIAIENTSENGYITEKFNDCILSWAKPFYFGAPNADIYFPPASFHPIHNLNCPQSVDQCIYLASTELNSDEIAAIREARELILYRYNIWNISDRLIRYIS